MEEVFLTISGNVQGVFFRAHTEEKARELGLSGWVVNAEDGSLEIHAEGPEASLERLKEWCYEGPDAATVESVHAEEVPEKGCIGFEIRHGL